ncbi:putative protein-disulfide oxidoreductase [Alteripontixanthobacter maritimus]|uniref:Thioredoxin-like fold domain-containing protein n=1 Tax=Alteripontixanthobacter maritimus TaxID=2161824 RepID=A0A369Q8U7_9SPHN|nr:thioredoxin domain-containing protein [Alteripontixanthobacter maritimus]RDC59576.1 putative protein-disulfide oxidoreductase [Alteripontixanthobacter maritimus]
MTPLRTSAFAWFAAPLVLALAACGSEDGTVDGEVPEGEAVAAVDAPEGTSWTEQLTVTAEDGYKIGNPDAPITLIEYASLTCPACASFASSGLEKLKADYIETGQVSFELRNQIHGPHDLALATLVRCGADESFHPLSDQVWLNLQEVLSPLQTNGAAAQQAMALPEDQRLVQIAEVLGFLDFFAARGLSKDQARQCLADQESYSAIAERSRVQSDELGVTGTPTFFINGRKTDAGNWAQLEPLLQRAGAR